MKTKTIDPTEIEKFSRIAAEWWDPRGKFKPLHDIGPVRVEWIVGRIRDWGLGIGEVKEAPLKGIRILDVGCGGGLVCEPLARLGADVTGIDASEKNISVAQLHAEQSGLKIDYRCMTAEALLENIISPESPIPNPQSRFDVVLALEIVEHVADVELFVESCAGLVKPGGIIIMSTLNRTVKSYAFAILGAEYVLRLLPRGTHDWNKFLKPSELCRSLQKNGIGITQMTGIALDPLQWKWKLAPKDLEVNYMVAGKKP